MLVVALVPLAIFAAVVAGDLGSVSRSTVTSANQAILHDAAEPTQQRELDNAAQVLATRLDSLTSQIRGLRGQLAAVLHPTTPSTAPGTPAVPGMAQAGGVSYHSDDAATKGAGLGSTILLPTTDPATASARLSALVAGIQATAAVEPLMEAAVGTSGVRYAWIAASDTGLVRVVPEVNVPEALVDGRIAVPGSDPDAPPFCALAASAASAAQSNAWAQDASRPPGEPPTSFTNAYDTGSGIGMTAWIPLSGTPYRIGFDVDLRQLLADVAYQSVSDQPNSYAVLLDDNGRILGGGQDVVSDFGQGRGGPLVGQFLHVADDTLHRQIYAVLGSGSRQTAEASLGGAQKVILTSPIGGAQWVLVSVVPEVGLLPDQQGLTHGIDSGVRRILTDAIPVAIGLCILAFILATFLARRVVGPVNALTAAVERLGSGDIESPIAAQGRDELGLLAVNMERMRREVSASRDAIMGAARELEERVNERTSELRARNEELVALNALAGSLTRSLDPDAILAGALGTLRAIVPVLAGSTFLLEGGRLVARESWADEGQRAGDDELAAVARDAADAREVTLRPGAIGMLVGLPLQTRDTVLGVVALVARPGWRLGGRARSLVRAVADQVALALRTAALSAEGRELAVLEERTRLAREIHDTIAQQLTAIVLQLEAAEAFVSRDSQRAGEVVVAARQLARSALREARRSVRDLRPAPLEHTGLAAAVTLEVGRWQRRTGIPTALHTPEVAREVSLPPQTEVALFRIAQEALSNVAKHSGAQRVEVRLEATETEVRLCVRDDGEGFTVDAGTHPGAFGLRGMEERARLIGADLSVTSAPGHGTEVLVRLALPDDAAAVLATATA